MQLLFAFVVCFGLIGSTTRAAVCDFNGCTYDTAEVGVTTITFNASGYFPSCIRVSADTDVQFDGPFTTYPLSGGYLELDTEVLFDSDITNVTTGTTETFTMTTGGAAPFFSPNNALNGFKGVIYVGASCDPSPPVAPVAPPTATPTAVPMTPTAAPTTPTAAPMTPTAPPTAAPTTPTAAPGAPSAAPTVVPSAEPQASAPSSEPVAGPSASTSAPTSAPEAATPRSTRPPRARVSSGAQTIASVAVLAIVGVAML